MVYVQFVTRNSVWFSFINIHFTHQIRFSQILTKIGALTRHQYKCWRCNNRVCFNCATRKRRDPVNGAMLRVCDNCIQLAEKFIFMGHRMRNIKLKENKRTGEVKIVGVSQSSKEYKEGIVNDCRIIEINEQNVQHLSAQLIADKLNTIKIPFSLYLDYTHTQVFVPKLKKENKELKEKYKIDDEKKECEDNKENGISSCKLKFRDWLLNVVKLEQYLAKFEENECDDIRMIQDLNENIIANDIGVKNKLHCKLIARKAKQYKQSQIKFNNLLESDNKLMEYTQRFEDNGILTLQDLHNNIQTKLQLGLLLRIMDEDKLNKIWKILLYPDDNDNDEENVPKVKDEEGQETECL